LASRILRATSQSARDATIGRFILDSSDLDSWVDFLRVEP
jgi:hypothetical protein